MSPKVWWIIGGTLVILLLIWQGVRVEREIHATGAAPKPLLEKGERKIQVFAGAASKPALEEVAQLYEQQYGTKVECTFGGSGTMLSQMLLAQRGDVYVPGSDDFMDKAEQKGVVEKGRREIVAYLLPVIAVQKGNPQNIQSLEDLARPGLRVGIARPEAVCLGDIALEIFEQAGLREKIEPNIVTQATSCSHTAALVKMRQVDAVIGWDVFAAWYPEDIEMVPLPSELRHWRYIPAAVTKFAREEREAQRFVDFLCSQTGKGIFQRHGYTVVAPGRE